MNIGIFSKFDVAGGSEFRCMEMASSIQEFSDHKAFIFSRSKVKSEIRSKLRGDVKVVENCFNNKEALYRMDCILVVNSDSKDFTTVKFWKENGIDLKQIKRMAFLFNFIVSPARFLNEFEKLGVDVRIITGNKRFFDELATKDKHKNVCHLPRMVLESPINPNSVYTHKTESDVIRIGKHSKPMGSKWGSEHKELIERLNKKYPGRLMWDFMGGSKEFCESLKGIENVILRPQFTVPVKVYLMNIDILLFLTDKNRQECWSRAVAESLMSGCPVIATDAPGGTSSQVIECSNGYMCKTVDDFEEKLSYLIDNPKMIKTLGRNANLYSRFFTSEEVIRKFLMFVGD